MAIRFPSIDVPVMGRSAKGVKSMALGKNDGVVMASPIGEQDDIAIFTDQGYAKLTKAYGFETQRRGGKGVIAMAMLKNGSTGAYIAAALPVSEPCGIVVTLKSGTSFDLSTEQLERSGRTTKGSPAVMAVLGDCVVSAYRSFIS
jgi:DNA gyrase subunit A